jgi:hypothetical protein
MKSFAKYIWSATGSVAAHAVVVLFAQADGVRDQKVENSRPY